MLKPFTLDDDKQQVHRAERAPRRVALYIEFNESFTGGPRLAANLIQSLIGSDIEPILFTNRESELTQFVSNVGGVYHLVGTPEALVEPAGGKGKRSLLKPIRSLLALWQLNQRLFREFHKHHVDLVWTRNVKGVCFVAIAASRQRVPLIWDVGMELPSRGFILLLHFIGFCIASAVVIQGKHVGEFIFHPRMLKVFQRKVMVVPSAIAPTRVSQLKQLRGHRKINEAIVNLVSVGTVNRRKDQLTLLKAFATICHDFPQARVLIAGPVTDLDYGQQLTKYVSENGLETRVEFRGWVDDVPALLLSSDLFVLTSRNEGVPQAVMEAMIAGVPVVASRVGGVPDVVQHGKTGFLFEAGDYEGLALQLRECLQKPQQLVHIGEQAATWIESNRSMENWARIYYELLNHLLANRTKA